MKKRHQAEEIIRILRDVESGPTIAEGIRRNNISEQTYYRWQRKYGAMQAEEGKRLKEVERENQKLKSIVAEQTLIIAGLREINSKAWIS